MRFGDRCQRRREGRFRSRIRAENSFFGFFPGTNVFGVLFVCFESTVELLNEFLGNGDAIGVSREIVPEFTNQLEFFLGTEVFDSRERVRDHGLNLVFLFWLATAFARPSSNLNRVFY